MISYPSTKRTILAGTLIAIAFAYVMAVKLVRGSNDMLAPLWLANVLPNFFGAAIVPLAMFISSRVIKLSDHLIFVVVFAIALSGYEVLQIWTPRRSFDWNDLVATAVGALVAAALGPILFLRRPNSVSPSNK